MSDCIFPWVIYLKKRRDKIWNGKSSTSYLNHSIQEKKHSLAWTQLTKSKEKGSKLCVFLTA